MKQKTQKNPNSLQTLKKQSKKEKEKKRGKGVGGHTAILQSFVISALHS